MTFARLFTPQVWTLPLPQRPGKPRDDIKDYTLYLQAGSVVELVAHRVVLVNGKRLGLSKDAEYERLHGAATTTKPVDSRQLGAALGNDWARNRDTVRAGR